MLFIKQENAMNDSYEPVKTGARLLETLTSALYADPLVVFREYVQNSIDAYKKLLRSGMHSVAPCCVDITIDGATRTVVIEDNCGGIPANTFLEEMTSLGRSGKEGEEDSIGFRGIGRLAGLSFCKKVVFSNKTDGAVQTYVLDGERYREILKRISSRDVSLDDVICSIASTEQETCKTTMGDGVSFRVELENVEDELFDCIFRSRASVGRHVDQRSELSDGKGLVPTDDFINELSLMLPVPYVADFDRKKDIEALYARTFSRDLKEREYDIRVNGKTLYKPYASVGERAYISYPIYFSKMGATSGKEIERDAVGVLWFSFDYVFKACRKNYGVAVRNKNMLVRGAQIFAEEAAKSPSANTSYSQFFSAVKGVQGELLLDTDLLSDNSRRDWFRTDAATLQLREQICRLMNKIHKYRYRMSRYIHDDTRTEEDKELVLDAFRDLASGTDEISKDQELVGYLTDLEKFDAERQIDERADVSDLRGYTKSQKEFYRRLMLEAYQYYTTNGKSGIGGYYSLKSFLLQRLNQDDDK